MADEKMQLLMTFYNETLQRSYERVCADVPLRRPATADEIASVRCFMASSEASIITVATLVCRRWFELAGGVRPDLIVDAERSLPFPTRLGRLRDRQSSYRTHQQCRRFT